jgi:hypothetical protein
VEGEEGKMIFPSGSPDMPMMILPDPIPPDPGDGDEMSWTDWLVVLAIVVVLIWLVITGIQWLGSYGNPSLEQVLRNQWEWAQNITITEGQKKARQERAWIARMTEYAVEMEQYEPPEDGNGNDRFIYFPIATSEWERPFKCYTIRGNRMEECR